GAFGPPTDGGWSAELILAHMAETSRTLADATRALIEGRAADYDSAAASFLPNLRRVVQQAGTLDGLRALSASRARELVQRAPPRPRAAGPAAGPRPCHRRQDRDRGPAGALGDGVGGDPAERPPGGAHPGAAGAARGARHVSLAPVRRAISVAAPQQRTFEVF